MDDRFKDFLANVVVGLVITALVFALGQSRDQSVLRCLCDGTFVSAVVIFGLGAIKAVRNKGAFDVMGFGVKSTVETFIPFLRRGEKEDFMQYRERKESKRKSASGMLLAGAAYLLLSAVFLGLYWRLR